MRWILLSVRTNELDGKFDSLIMPGINLMVYVISSDSLIDVETVLIGSTLSFPIKDMNY